MSSFPILDLVIGMIFIYFLLSIICSSGVELLLSIQGTRAKMLEKWLKTIFDSPAFDSHGLPMYDKNRKSISIGQAIMDHCMVTALSKAGRSTSYINAENFVSALLDKITIEPKTTTQAAAKVQIPPNNLSSYITAIEKTEMISGELKRTILILAYEARQAALAIKNTQASVNITDNVSTAIKSEMDHFRERVEHWYDTNNDRLTGKFKRTKVLPKTIFIAIAITVGLNIDSLEISRYLYNHRDESKQFADYALTTYGSYKDRVEKIRGNLRETNPDTSIQTLNSNLQQVKNDIDSLHANLPSGLPMGWVKNEERGWGHHIPGWVATVLAITLGAPFWFDILNKIANLRNNGPKPVVTDEKIDKK